jgi:hypothetical protein
VLPAATVVKAFNTVFFQRLLDDSHPELPAGDRLAIPVAAAPPARSRLLVGGDRGRLHLLGDPVDVPGVAQEVLKLLEQSPAEGAAELRRYLV